MLKFQWKFFPIQLLFQVSHCFGWTWFSVTPLLWRHNGRDSVSNHQPQHCLLNCLFGRRSKKPSKLRVTDLCAAKMASNAENGSIWWRHHDPNPPILTSSVASINLFIYFYIITWKYMLNEIKTTSMATYFFFIFVIYIFLIQNNQGLWYYERPGTRSCDRPGLHIPGRAFFFCFSVKSGYMGYKSQHVVWTYNCPSTKYKTKYKTMTSVTHFRKKTC